MNDFITEFESLNLDGSAAGTFENRHISAFGVLPGEKALLRPVRRKQRILFAEPLEILQPSAFREDPVESHYLSCSPWQIIEYPVQCQYKQESMRAAFISGAQTELKINDFFGSGERFGYRTKIEFGIAFNDGAPVLSFHPRGKHFGHIALEHGCALASDAMNSTALAIMSKLSEQKSNAGTLKNLVIRESKHDRERLAVLYTIDRMASKISAMDIPGLSGLVIAYSDPASPASVVTEILATSGKDYLEETVLEMRIRYPFDGFFQNNIPLFEKCLSVIGQHIAPTGRIAELYSGVGTIGLALAKDAAEVTGIESGRSSVEYARVNAQLNSIENYTSECLLAEKCIPEKIKSADTVILDPPRCGLHPKAVKLLFNALPEQIAYLSCNVMTQAKDFSMLKDHYAIAYAAGFDFYPNTPHLESLIILQKKQ
jgi:23S rRNA (uracil1939-C5)-methyltransferase